MHHTEAGPSYSFAPFLALNFLLRTAGSARALVGAGLLALGLAAAGPAQAQDLVLKDTDGDTITSLSVPAGGTVTYTVEFGAQPSGNTMITVTATALNSRLTVMPSSLDFTTTNWNTPQPVTLTASAGGPAMEEVVHASPEESLPLTVHITEPTDPVTPPVRPPTTVRLSAAPAAPGEDAGDVTITARLNRAATRRTTVTLMLGGSAASGEDYAAPPDPFTIVIRRGAKSGTATLTITDDDVDEGNETIVLTPTVTPSC